MLTTRAASALLRDADSLDALQRLVAAAGLGGEPVDLDRATAAGLGVDASPARLACGVGAIRVLFIEDGSREPLRLSIQRLAGRLAARAPHVLWILAIHHHVARTSGIAAWSMEDRRLRIVSLLWEPDAVTPSDVETVVALAATRSHADVLQHARWLDVLGRESLTRRFYRVLDSQVGALGSSLPRMTGEDGRAVSLLYVSRLLFLCFLEAKGWLDGDRTFLASQFDECMRNGGRFHERVLLPLFFGTLNTPVARRARRARRFGRVPFLNGGLFTRTPLERRFGAFRFEDDKLGALLEQVFQRFRFVAREDSADWSEASVDPEMLGRAFECLMAPAERRTSGAFYTPHALVSRVADHAIAALPHHDTRTLQGLRAIRVLDPACGSGAFLVHVLERLADLRRIAGDSGSVTAIRRDVLTRSIYGVDRDPTAVWLCELRLWLAVVIDCEESDPRRVTPLPNLDRNIRVGDALSGAGFTTHDVAGVPVLRRLRERYVRSTGTRKRTLARELDRAERRRALFFADRGIDAAHHARREFLDLHRARDLFGERRRRTADDARESRRLRDALRAARLERRRLADGGALPFSFSACFAEAHAAGGFNLVIGNPPWVRLHRIPGALREQFRRDYAVFRSASWESGAADAHASTGFASQVDLAALFVERSVTLTREDGCVALLLPAKLWRSLSAGGVRRFVMERTAMARLEDLSESRHAFDAAVYPSLLVTRRTGQQQRSTVDIAIHDRGGARHWTASPATIPFDRSAGAPWVLLPRDARASFDLLRDRGVPLAHSAFGAPRLGVKSGCNSAFLVRVVDSGHDIATIVDADGELGKMELSLLRPALRGDGVARWRRAPSRQWIVWTHDERGPLPKLPDRARAWLRRHYGTLAERSDAARTRRWWSLFRTDAADTATPRVVWADFGRRPRALVLDAHDPVVPLNTCYVIRCPDTDDAWALAAILNSPLAAAWLNALAEPARGGFRRYLGWTVGQLPLPIHWAAERLTLARMARSLAHVETTPEESDDCLTAVVCDAYGVTTRECAALISQR